MANRVIGLKNLYIAEKLGENQYAEPIRLVGAKSVKTSNENNEVMFYSDDIMDVYTNALTAMSLEVELAYLTPEIESLITGKEINEVGALVTGTNDKQKTVAFLYEMTTLEKPIRRVLYETILTRTDSEATTKADKIDEQTITLTGKAKARDIDGKFDLVMDSNNIPVGKEEAFNTTFGKFFTGVVLPDGTISSTSKAKR